MLAGSVKNILIVIACQNPFASLRNVPFCNHPGKDIIRKLVTSTYFEFPKEIMSKIFLTLPVLKIHLELLLAKLLQLQQDHEPPLGKHINLAIPLRFSFIYILHYFSNVSPS